MRLDIPVHLIAGAEPGPTLKLQGAIHGAEIIGSIAILDFVAKADPGAIRGNVIAVPVVNRAGFEMGTRGSLVDEKDISRLFPGKKGRQRLGPDRLYLLQRMHRPSRCAD